jgi:gamma-glutamyl:cysteine ligase YbdK (ATP-grasp superfamily)
MNQPVAPLRLWAGFGVELEYMLVDAHTLEVRPIADQLFHRVTGTPDSEVERGGIAWSNELVLHLIELKTGGPVAGLAGLGRLFQDQIREINAQLASFEARLMPSGMHPWMDPVRETELWPHAYAEVYRAYDRIFGCRAHGYANLQSMHLNLSFGDDAEFGRLHAACRVLLPLLPAMAASSPFADGGHSGWLDHRLEAYRHNADRIPSIVGRVIPEPCFNRAVYQERILEVIRRDIGPLDPEGWLQPEFLNARGAIARFSRGSLEIRLLDVQECVTADLALAGLVIAVLRLLTEERWSSLAELQAAETTELEEVLDETVRHADAAAIVNVKYLKLLGWHGRIPCSVRDLWRHLVEAVDAAAGLDAGGVRALEGILREGPLARRLLRAIGSTPNRLRLRAVYRELCDCLAEDRLFDPGRD